MKYEARNIGAILLEWSKIDPHAVSVEQQGRRYTRAEVIGAAQSLATFFKESGVKNGESIAVLPGDPLRGIEAMIALWSLEAAVLFLDPRQPVEDIDRTRDMANIDAVFTDIPSFARKAECALLPPREEVVQTGHGLTFPPASHTSDALILSSSGTIDFPRFRRVSHHNFVESTQVGGRILGNPIPFSSVLIGSLAFGAVLGNWIRVMINGRFILSLPLFSRIEELDQALCRKDIQAVGLPPVLIRDLLAHHNKVPTNCAGPKYPHIQRLISVGGPIAPQDLVKAYSVLTPGVKNLYSMTGVGAVSILSGEEILRKSDSVGKPLPEMTVRVEDADGNSLPDGQTGQIVVKRNWEPGAVAVNSGDMGWFDSDGYLFVSGRNLQMATRNSVNIHLPDLEQDAKQLKEVRDCVAFSAKSESTPDDRIFLAVETDATIDFVRKRLRDTIAAYRRPDKILVSKQLPRSSSNKIVLRLLRDMANEKENGFVDF